MKHLYKIIAMCSLFGITLAILDAKFQLGLFIAFDICMRTHIFQFTPWKIPLNLGLPILSTFMDLISYIKVKSFPQILENANNKIAMDIIPFRASMISFSIVIIRMFISVILSNLLTKFSMEINAIIVGTTFTLLQISKNTIIANYAFNVNKYNKKIDKEKEKQRRRRFEIEHAFQAMERRKREAESQNGKLNLKFNVIFVKQRSKPLAIKGKNCCRFNCATFL